MGSQTVITPDALELMSMLTKTLGDLTVTVEDLSRRAENLRAATIQPALLTEQEAAVYLGISAGTLRSYRSTGQIGNRAELPPYVKIGDSARYDIDDLYQFRKTRPRFDGRKK